MYFSIYWYSIFDFWEGLKSSSPWKESGWMRVRMSGVHGREEWRVCFPSFESHGVMISFLTPPGFKKRDFLDPLGTEIVYLVSVMSTCISYPICGQYIAVPFALANERLRLFTKQSTSWTPHTILRLARPFSHLKTQHTLVVPIPILYCWEPCRFPLSRTNPPLILHVDQNYVW